MNYLDLNGAWTLRTQKQKRTIAATVPGCVHTDLLAAGLIENPFHRDNESQVQWIGHETWVYERTFVLHELEACDAVRLRCQGLDTLATVILNDVEVGRGDNMHRTWEFDVAGALRPGQNRLVVIFDPPVDYIENRHQERPVPGWNAPFEPAGRAWLRKMACNFGWDWGPVLPTSGIWRDIGLVFHSTARIADLHIRQDHTPEDAVGLDVSLSAECFTAGALLEADVKVSYKGSVIAEARGHLAEGRAQLRATIRNPQLWWPNGMGEQPLYEVTVELHGPGRVLLDEGSRRVGLRTLGLQREQDEWGESFHFAVNGVPFFAKGANWIPADAFVTRLTRVEYARLIKAAAMANMNMLRVWGGGIYENDCFYDLCDEYGICVWQDFMFACSTYPTYDEAWLANCQVEFEQNIRRLRHHASLALWVGNNELEQGLVGDTWDGRRMSWADYSRLFDDLLPRLVQQLDPDRAYWPGSPHTPPPGDRKNFNDPTRGDGHLWSVWHGREPFEWYRTSFHRFCSEFGFQSFQEPRGVAAFTEPQDRNITSHVMEKHQRSGIGNVVIMQYMLAWYRMPVGFENTLWLSQIQQGMAIKYAVEHWRRNRPRCMGALYWQLNDCWPVASWASIDYDGRWKALHYMARRFYAPVLVSGVEDAKAGTVEIHISNDNREAFSGEVLWRVTQVDGTLLREHGRQVSVEAGSTVRLGVLKMGDLLKKVGERDLMVWLALHDGEGKTVSTNFVSFCRPKHMELRDPRIRAEIRPWDDNSYAVTLTARHPALWAWLSLADVDAKIDDNFFCLEPRHPVRVRVTPAVRMKLDQFRNALRIRSIRDTYQEAVPVPAVDDAVEAAVRELKPQRRGRRSSELAGPALPV